MITSGSLKSMNLLKILTEAESKSFNGTVTLKGKTGLASITLKGGKVVFIREPRVKSRLGRYLVSRNIITEKELQSALNAQKTKGGVFLGEILIEQMQTKTIMDTLGKDSTQLHIPLYNQNVFNLIFTGFDGCC